MRILSLVLALVFAALPAAAQSIAIGSASNPLAVHIEFADSTGLTTTATAGGTFYPLKGDDAGEEALLAVDVDAAGSAWSMSTSTGVLTPSAAAFGRYLVQYCVEDVISNNSAAVQARLELGGSAVGPVARVVMPSTAARTSMGCMVSVVTIDGTGDTIEMNVTSGTNSDVVTVRAASLTLLRIGLI